jgi:Transglycosylase SLT domain
MMLRRSSFCVLLVSLVSLVGGQPAETVAQSLLPTPQRSMPRDAICPTIETVARANALPLDFFVRVIWRESEFRPDVVGPITRSGSRAQGIAQFMPATAAERGLLHPFDPSEALPQSGAFLAQLRDEFGNLGLAAAAYNAGPQRVRDFLAGIRSLPDETRHYVLAVTGQSVDAWKEHGSASSKREPGDGHAAMDCDDLLAMLRRTSASSQPSSERNVPAWCRYLHVPNASVCGSVHAPASTLARELNQRRRTKSSLR